MKHEVENALRRAGFSEATSFRFGFTVQPFSGERIVATSWIRGRHVASLNKRIDMLMAMRDALRHDFAVNLYGSHFVDGRPVCLLVSPRSQIVSQSLERVLASH